MIRISKLKFSYENSPVFDNFDFVLSKRIGIIRGPSGSGKTTFLKILHGILNPKLVGEFSVPKRSFLILQDDNLAPWLTGNENLSIFLQKSVSHFNNHPLFPLVADILDKRGHEMSFGQRRIIELFRAFLTETEMLLLDEPLNYIDPARRLTLINFLKSDQCPKIPIILTAHFTDNVTIDDAEFFEFEGDAPFSSLKSVINNGV